MLMIVPDDSSADAATSDATQPSDFGALRSSGVRSGISLRIGTGFTVSRDALARWLLRLGVRPNHCTVAGFFVTVAAGVCLAIGAGHVSPWGKSVGGLRSSFWPLAAGALIFLSSAADMLDGSLARLGLMRSRSGALLDSTLDRFSDMAVFVGCVWYFAATGNLTYTVLAVVGLCNWVLISYVKARAEEMISDCRVGYWFRGERMAALLIAALCSHVPALLWQQAILPALTVLRRMVYAAGFLRAEEQGKALPHRGPFVGALRYLAPWRFPRGSIPYDIVTGLNIAYLIFGPWIWPALYGSADPLGDWWELVARG